MADGIDQDCDNVDACYTDADGDNYGTAVVTNGTSLVCSALVSTDCDDTDAAINPAASEICDAADTDEDCDGLADDDDSSATDPSTFYVDTDGDGHGGASAAYCDMPSGYVTDATDCDDTSASVYLGATEVVADGIDQDCDNVDACYTDADGDNFGTTVVTDGTSLACSASVSADCDDSSSSINPAATELAGDAVDQDCDTTESCYVDADYDGARTAFVVASPDVACTAAGEALATADVDCDDTDATAYPAATELVGTGVDEDCDGAELCYVDADGDAYRPDDTSIVDSADADCTDAGEALASALTGDCDDTSTAYNPAAAETDCSDPTDYNCDGSSGYSNADGDAYAACEECDDSDDSVYPGAAEIAGDGIDGDCDGVDTCYVDDDGDGYRTTATVTGTTVACNAAGEATVDAGTDCDDADATVNPAAVETIGDERDMDCDGAESCYTDADADGYRTEDGAVVLSEDTDCADATEALVSDGFDCDDTQTTINPAATEIAGDGVDGDCDDADLCYVDADGDGYRLADTVLGSVTCDGAGEALASADPDCDDGDASVSPDGVELAGDAIDSDCDGTELCYADADADGYVDGSGVTIDSVDTDCDDPHEALATALSGDCDDADAAYNPAAAETDCSDANDYNCDGSSGYADADADGWAACEECDDADATVNPDATEGAGDLVDQDCDGVESCYVDADGDGYRPDATSIVSGGIACDGAGEAVATDPTTDCDDADAAVNPGATEIVGDEVDQSCDNDEECYVDADDDGYVGTGGATVASADLLCDGAGEASTDAQGGDCDDSDAAYNPGALEDACDDPADYDCDGSSGVVDGDGDGFYACEECDDALGTVNPDADEVCNDLDDDCDGTVDVDAIDAETWYADADADGFTDPDEVTAACDAPDGYAAATEDDCDDADATSNPDGDDIPDDGIDQDCDGIDATGGVPDDTGDTAKDDATGCGCASGNGVGAAWSLLLGVLALGARRRRAA